MKSLFFILFSLSIVISTQAKILYVDDDALGGDGSSWANAYQSLQDALADATADPIVSEIRVGQGTYRPDETAVDPNGTGDRGATFQLVNGVALMGGYAGVGEIYPDERDYELYETVLSGDLDGNDVDVANNSENSYHVTVSSGTDATAILDGFVITKGNSSEFSPIPPSGGGMVNRNGSATVLNCTFLNNTALDQHGWGSGGGVNNYNSSSKFINCKFIDNLSKVGAGVSNRQWQSEQAPEFINCVFIENHSTDEGGAMMNYESSPRVINCLFIGNLAGNYGGGMYNTHNCSPTVTNCTFFGNSAEFGDGGGIYNLNNIYYGDSTPNLTNCILWNNSDSGGVDESAQICGGIPIINYNCVQGWTDILNGTDNIDTDPLLTDPNNSDFHLKSQAGRYDPIAQSWVIDSITSPCVDAGDPSTLIGWEPYPNGAIVNMGAYGGTVEASKSYFGTTPCETPIAGDINGDCKVDLIDFSIMAFHWLEDNSG